MASELRSDFDILDELEREFGRVRALIEDYERSGRSVPQDVENALVEVQARLEAALMAKPTLN